MPQISPVTSKEAPPPQFWGAIQKEVGALLAAPFSPLRTPAPQNWGGGAVRRGFTLIELIVVLFVLLLMTTAIVPRVVAIQRSRRIKDLEAKIIRLPAEARNEAVRSGTPVRLRVDGTALVMDRAPIGGQPEEVKRIALGTSIQVDTVELGGQPSNVGSWQWTIYPDGSADAGGVQFTEDTAQKSLLLSSDGSVRWVRGDLPAGAPEQWPAGQIQQRS